MNAPVPSWYDVLGVEPDATPEEIRGAWRSAIADLDPGDRRFQTLNQAAEVLLDAERRAQHDQALVATAPVVVEAPSAPAPVTSRPDEVDEDAAVAEEPPAAAPVAAPTPGRQARALPRAVVLLAESWVLASAAVLAIALVVSAVLVLREDDGSAPGLPDARQVAAARAAAEAAIVPVLSYDYRDLDAARAAAQAYLTADQRERYDLLFDEQIAPNAEATQSVVTTRVIASGIVRTGRDLVDVLLFVNRPTTNRERTVEYRDQVTARMLEVGGDWLLDCLITQPGASCGDDGPTGQPTEDGPTAATTPATPAPSATPATPGSTPTPSARPSATSTRAPGGQPSGGASETSAP